MNIERTFLQIGCVARPARSLYRYVLFEYFKGDCYALLQNVMLFHVCTLYPLVGYTQLLTHFFYTLFKS